VVGDLLAALLPVVALVGIFWLILRSARPHRGEGTRGARSFRALRRYTAPDFSSAPWAAVMVIAGISVTSWAPDASTAAVLGLLTGVVAAVSHYIGDLLVGALGLVGVIDAARRMVEGDTCFDAPTSARMVSLAVVLVLGVPAFLIGRYLPGNRRSTSIAVVGLSMFVVVEVAAFLSTPLGVPVVASGSTGLVLTSALAAFVLGLGFGYAPALGAVLLGAAVAVGSATSAAAFGTTCSFAGDWGQVTGTAAFVILAVLTRAVGGRVTGRV
jgi:hypothetical protein